MPKTASIRNKGDRVETYRELESVLQGDEGCLTSGVVNRLIAEASSDIRAAQGLTGDVKMAASDVLVALARSHFHFVMSELQSHLKAMGKVPDEFMLLTLALRCIPFVGMTLLALRAMLSQVGSGRILRAVCSVLEQWSEGVNTYFCNWEQCPFPRKGEAQFCEAIHPIFRYAMGNWLDCKEEEDKQAVLGAVAAMMRVLLHEEQHREHAWEQLLWLLHQCQEVRDTSRVTKSLSCVLEMLEGVQSPIAQGTALAISTTVHRQLSDVTKEPGPAHRAVLSRCIVLQAQICPEETVTFLLSQLSSGSEAGRVAALGLLQVLAHSDAPATREKLPQVVEAMRWCATTQCPGELVWEGTVPPGDTETPSLGAELRCLGKRRRVAQAVRRAVLELIRELLSSGSQSCWAWDVVGHIFIEFSRTSGRQVAGGLFTWETQEDGALRALCMDILGSLDVSLRGMTKLLWPRLLQYVVPAQYSGMLIPLSRCLRALVERRERAGCKEEEEEPDAMDSQEQAQLPAPQALLARLLVVVAAPYMNGERAVAALQLLQALRRIHKALGAWATEIPLLLQFLEGKVRETTGLVFGVSLKSSESFCFLLLSRKTRRSLDSAEWEHRVLKFLRASLEPIEDRAWMVGLSQELSQQLGSSAPSSWEKGMISVVSHAAESHFHLVLDTVTMFSAALTRDWLYQTSTGWKARRQQKMESAQAICAALMRTYSGIALRAPKEQLLTRVDKEIMGNILRLSRAKERDLQLKLALVQSITEVSCAIQAVGDCGSFELSVKQGVTRTLLDWIKGKPWDSLVYGVFQALEELSKLRPPLSREDNRNLLAVCCQSVLSYPSMERMNKGRKTARAAVNMQLLHRRGIEDLGQLIETLLEAEATSACFDDVVHVLKGWLTSAKEWKRERALQVCAHVLGACKERFELMRGHPCKQFGSLVGLLGTLTSDCLVTSRQRAWVCLGYLLQMQAKTMKGLPQADEIRCLCEELNSPDPKTLGETCTKIAKVPKILNTLYTYMQQSTHRPFLLHVVFLHPLSPGAHDQQSPPERSAHGQITHAISEVVLALRSTEELRQLLPHLLPSLLRWASETLGEERLLSPMSSWRQLFLEGQVPEEKPCRFFLSAIEMVLGKCMAQKWMQLLTNRAVWARLEDPLAHPEGVCLLSSVLLRTGLISPSLVKNLLPWLDSCSVKLRVTAMAFFAEVFRPKMNKVLGKLGSSLDDGRESTQVRHDHDKKSDLRGKTTPYIKAGLDRNWMRSNLEEKGLGSRRDAIRGSGAEDEDGHVRIGLPWEECGHPGKVFKTATANWRGFRMVVEEKEFKEYLIEVSEWTKSKGRGKSGEPWEGCMSYSLLKNCHFIRKGGDP
ncbi:LOW QUALITY PROTEIN: maestro heat-like repeat-containing protein family member 2B [Phoenicopterus ruber ruber]